MKDFIRDGIDPPGVEKKNLGSLFSAIGRVFGRVSRDAERAFRSHFPFLADPPALRRHAKALGIPEFPHDREEELRDRVSAASFFLARAGERSYIIEQLRGHFGDGLILKEEFLRVLVSVAGMGTEDREWIHGFLDGLLDPNIALTVAEWFRFLEVMDMTEELRVRARRNASDSFAGEFVCDGRFLCDQGRLIACDGSWSCDGSVAPAGFVPARGTVLGGDKEESTGPVLPSSAFGDSLSVRGVLAPVKDKMEMSEGLTVRIVQRSECDGKFDSENTVCEEVFL
ncbi:MAG: hypothetical protein FWD94_08175 [Treponema sp.]|nr:hypothetical protein [Treponema sp.]